MRGTLDEWTPEARRRGISLEARLPVGPLPLYGDPIRLTQALGNLIENALKYAGSGGWVRVDVGPPLVGSYEVAVTDSGPGIPLAVPPRDLGQARHAERPGVGIDDEEVHDLARLTLGGCAAIHASGLRDLRVRPPREPARDGRVRRELEQPRSVERDRVAQRRLGPADDEWVALVRRHRP